MLSNGSIRTSAFAVALCAAALSFAGCGSVNRANPRAEADFGGFDPRGLESMRESSGGEYAPANGGTGAKPAPAPVPAPGAGVPEDDLPTFEVTGTAPVKKPDPPKQPDPPPAKPPVVEPRPIDKEPVLPPPPPSVDDFGASLYDHLQANGNDKNGRATFNKGVAAASSWVESFTKAYRRLLETLNPGF
jgi:hypothetical protein